jgi:hypothetical protein
MVAVRKDRNMSPRRGLNFVWFVVLQICRADGATVGPTCRSARTRGSASLPSRAPNAAGVTGRVARPVKYGGDNGKPWRGALFHRARPVKYGKDNG